MIIDDTWYERLCVPVPAIPSAPHCTIVAELHDVVLQAVAATMNVGVVSIAMKFNPLTVMLAPLVDGVLVGKAAVTTGASNVNVDCAVLTTACTVMPVTLAVP